MVTIDRYILAGHWRSFSMKARNQRLERQPGPKGQSQWEDGGARLRKHLRANPNGVSGYRRRDTTKRSNLRPVFVRALPGTTRAYRPSRPPGLSTDAST